MAKLTAEKVVSLNSEQAMDMSASPENETVAENASKKTPRYWRSLDELQQTPEFDQYLHREFPKAASELPEGVSRRRWIQLMGASLGLAGVAGCRYSEESILPFTVRPEGRIPGEFYDRATNIELAGRAYHLLVRCVDGRPVKIEGNPDHPAMGSGGTDGYVQASILGLFDPDRARGENAEVFRRDGAGARPRSATWADFDAFAADWAKELKGSQGKGLVVVAPPTHSPSMVRMLGELKQQFPESVLCRFDTMGRSVIEQASKAAIGTASLQRLDLDKADVILALQADILGTDPGMIHQAAGFSKGRDPSREGGMNRLYCVEGGFSATGTTADVRFMLRPSQMPAFLAELERRVDALAGAAEAPSVKGDVSEAFDREGASWEKRLNLLLDTVAEDLVASGEKGVVVVGEHLGPEAVAAGIRLNSKLGSLGKVQQFIASPGADLDAIEPEGLASALESASSVMILGENPVFTAPGDIDLLSLLSASNIKHAVYLGESDDETGQACHWSLPASHPLESWGDVVGAEGHYGVCQPQILPLLGGKSALEFLASFLGLDKSDGESIVRQTADAFAGASLSNRQWRQLLHDGFHEDLIVKAPAVEFVGDAAGLTDAKPVYVEDANPDDVDVLFVASECVYDGRFANNGWLQETPQTVTRMVWDNAAVMSPATARAFSTGQGGMVALRNGNATLEVPVFIIPGIAPGVVTLTMGYGRTRAGAVGGMVDRDVPAVGVNVGPLRSMGAMLTAVGLESRPRYDSYEMATTQNHWAIDQLGKDETESRSHDLVREGTAHLFNDMPDFAYQMRPHVPPVGDHGSMWTEPIVAIEEEKKELPQWGMSIDLNRCTGCNACLVACQSENNVPIVGKDQVLMGREMHWIRLDRYFQGDETEARIVQLPVACQHCETAPCEQVCPVAATVHTDEGINAMAYNRCIGTRYCANNCPFKVRRFNYFNYNEDVGVGYGIYSFPGNLETANRKLQQLVLNPEVTVRGRGVMEKCTYCVQRVEQAKIAARRDGGRPIQDGDVKTACQTACPSDCIEFGNVADKESAVSKAQNDVRRYSLLDQLNVKPRTTYLSKVRNVPGPLMTMADFETIKMAQEMKEMHSHGHHGHGEEHDGEEHGDAKHDDHVEHHDEEGH